MSHSIFALLVAAAGMTATRSANIEWLTTKFLLNGLLRFWPDLQRYHQSQKQRYDSPDRDTAVANDAYREIRRGDFGAVTGKIVRNDPCRDFHQQQNGDHH